MEGVGEGMRSVWEYFENTVLNYVNISHNQEIKLYQQGWKIVKTEFKQKQTDVSVYQIDHTMKWKRIKKN